MLHPWTPLGPHGPHCKTYIPKFSIKDIFSFFILWKHFFGHSYPFESYQFHSWCNVELQKAKSNGKYNSYYEQLLQEWIDWRYWSSVWYVMLTQVMNNLLPWFRVTIGSFYIVLNVSSASLVENETTCWGKVASQWNWKSDTLKHFSDITHHWRLISHICLSLL